jgi:hypothetical protein
LVPFELITRGRKKLDLNSSVWSTVKAMTVDLNKIEQELDENEKQKK